MYHSNNYLNLSASLPLELGMSVGVSTLAEHSQILKTVEDTVKILFQLKTLEESLLSELEMDHPL